MKIRIKKAGLHSNIQDLGRFHYLSQAVPVSGAMDNLSAQLANIALGNPVNSAVIEFTQGGASFIAENDILISVSGDGAFLGSQDGRLPSDLPIFIPAGTDLYLENNKTGSRSYLAVAGGWDVPKVLGSRSTYVTAKIGGLNGRCLAANDQLCSMSELTPLSAAILNDLNGDRLKYPGWTIARSLFLPADRKTIRIMPGREFNWFDKVSKDSLLSQTYAIGRNSNRMGYNLQGAQMKREIGDELLSTAVTPGTIQVTNNGDLTMLMADCQTTGGYPRIAQVAAADMPLCGQLKPGDLIAFKEVSWKEAEKLYLEQKHSLRKLATAIMQKYL
jgi:antagonist of KipI